MHSDLINLTKTTISTPAPATTVARLARRALVAMSVVLAVGLAGVVFARGTDERPPRVVWVLRGHAVVSQAQPDSESTPVVVLPVKPVAESRQTVPENSKPSQPRSDAEPQLAKAEIQPHVERASLAKPQAAVPADLPEAAAGRVVMMEVTAYCPCTKCCGPNAQGITASGKDVSYNDGKFVAADRKLSFGTQVIIPGYGDGRPVEVIDRGGAIKGDKLDVFFPSHQEALEWGRQKIPVIVRD